LEYGCKDTHFFNAWHLIKEKICIFANIFAWKQDENLFLFAVAAVGGADGMGTDSVGEPSAGFPARDSAGKL
jgi:hypothetical protein